MSQRSMLAGRVKKYHAEMAKERQKKSEGRGKKKGPVNLPEVNGDARDTAGATLKVSQRSMIGARAKGVYSEEAKERQKAAGKSHGNGKAKVVENLPQQKEPAPRARDQAAAAVSVSGRLAKFGRLVQSRASKPDRLTWSKARA